MRDALTATPMTLSGVVELCARLSAKIRSVVRALIEILMEKESAASNRVLELENLLTNNERPTWSLPLWSPSWKSV